MDRILQLLSFVVPGLSATYLLFKLWRDRRRLDSEDAVIAGQKTTAELASASGLVDLIERLMAMALDALKSRLTDIEARLGKVEGRVEKLEAPKGDDKP